VFAFRAENVWEGDADDNVIATGAEWTEECEWASDFLMQAQWLLSVAVFGLIFLASFESKEQELLWKVVGGLVALVVVVFFFGHHLCTVKRELMFRADGSIVMALGQPGWFKGALVPGDHQQILTIQAQPVEHHENKLKPRKYEVWLYYDDGGCTCVAERIYQAQAHQVTVLLTRALTDMRSAMAIMPGVGTGGLQFGVTIG